MNDFVRQATNKNMGSYGTVPLNMGEFQNNYSGIAAYIGHAATPYINEIGQSGGIATRIAVDLMLDHKIDAVIGVAYSPIRPDRTIPYIAETIPDLFKLAGSKYLFTNLLDILPELDPQKRYMLTGLPCQIAEIDRLQKNGQFPNIVLKVAVYCGQVMTESGVDDIVSRMSKGGNLIDFKYRVGWPGDILVSTSAGESTVSKLLYRYHFRISCDKTCWFCTDYTGNHADISLADNFREDGKNGSGSSVITTMTKLGDDVLKGISELAIRQVPFEEGLGHHTGALEWRVIRNLWRWSHLGMAGKFPDPEADQRFKLEEFFNEIYYLPEYCTPEMMEVKYDLAWKNFKSGGSYDFLLPEYTSEVRQVYNDRRKQALTGKSSVTTENRSVIESVNRNSEIRRVLVIGGYGSGNLGDFSQLSGTLENLEVQLPGVEVTVTSKNTKRTLTYLNSSSYKLKIKVEPNFNSVLHSDKKHIGKRNWYKNRIKLLERKAALFLYNLLPFDDDDFALFERVNQYDMLNFSGSGTLNHTSATWGSTYNNLVTLLLFQLLRKKTIVSAQGVGPVSDPMDREMIARTLKHADAVTVRDRESLDLCYELDVSNVELGVDDAYFIAADESVDLLMREAGITDDRGIVGINLSFYKYDEKLKNLLLKVADFCFKKGLQVLVIVTEPLRDLDAAHDLVNANPSICLLQRTDINANQIKGIVSKLQFGIGTRNHFIVYALASAVPCIGLGVDDMQTHKFRGLSCDFPMEVATVDDSEDVIALVNSLLANSDTIRSQLKEINHRLLPKKGLALKTFLNQTAIISETAESCQDSVDASMLIKEKNIAEEVLSGVFI
ncbi:MAG: polysaccharide pyruvyl transferase family protein [Calditrichaeota bacterium]|nr:polysaccharide pyruvyl transferase family protein [Calditrichota bacterium]